MNPSKRLSEAIKQVVIVREGTIPSRAPDRDAALARAEYVLRGVRDELQEPDEIEPHQVT